MSFSVVKIIPKDVTTIGDDGKNRSSHLFDKSLDTRWSYKGKFAYNIVILENPINLDSLIFHWYMKKKERRAYRFGIYLSDTDIAFTSNDFESVKRQVQELYNDPKTIRSTNNEGDETTTIKFDGNLVKSFIIIYTYSSNRKSWFSVKEIEILGKVSSKGSDCPPGTRLDLVSNDCKPILSAEDQYSFDPNGVLLWDDDNGDYVQEYHTFTRNFNKDGSMSLDISPHDTGGKWLPDTETVIFLQLNGTNNEHEVSCKTIGEPYEVLSISFDAKKVRYRQEVDGNTNKLEEMDISGLNLPDTRGIWYGFVFANRRVLRKSDNKLLGRMLTVKLNPMPFDVNRNVQNQNWIDVASFLDYGHDLIDGPRDPKKFVEKITTDGNNASTYLYRFFRHCQILPVIVEDEAEMSSMLKKERNEVDEDEEERVDEIVQTVMSQPKHIAPKYPAPFGEHSYFVLSDDTRQEMLSGTIQGDFRNIEATAILNFSKTASGYFRMTARNNYHAVFHAKGESLDGVGTDVIVRPLDFANFMINIPSFRNKKVGIKWCLRTVKQYDEKEQMYEVVISEAFLNLKPEDPEYEYSPWWRAIYRTDIVNKKDNFIVGWDKLDDFTTDAFEVREIEPVPEIRRL
jgi:hypothetical protein